MYRTLLIIIALGLAGPGRAAAEDLREQTSRDWDAKGLVRLEVDNSRGSTTVRASHDGRVHLVAFKVVKNGDRDGGHELARATHVEADLEADRLLVRVHYPQRREIHLDVWDLIKGIEIPEIEVRLTLEVPPALDVSLHAASGDLETVGLAGHQDLGTASGDIDVTDATGVIDVQTRSGDATLTDVASAGVGSLSGDVLVTAARGAVDVGTQSGDVRIDSATDTVTVATTSGEVRVGLARGGLDVRTQSGDVIARAGGRVRVHTASGEARVALVPPLRHAEFITASGDVNVRVAVGIECQLDADAGNGEVDVQLPLDVRTIKGNHVVGRIGRGAAGIVIQSSSGSVSVAR